MGWISGKTEVIHRSIEQESRARAIAAERRWHPRPGEFSDGVLDAMRETATALGPGWDEYRRRLHTLAETGKPVFWSTMADGWWCMHDGISTVIVRRGRTPDEAHRKCLQVEVTNHRCSLEARDRLGW